MLLSIKALLSYSFHLMFIVKDIAKIENLYLFSNRKNILNH
ncbi:hypothetical protein HMPREF9145_1696 [Segatella salivae F0493]|uniref:Uncharacterized protein n=1 Tax=Segatella salivae F0493 TaxID=1395125 RepID=U2L2Z9_9BACT|nr:hypothetical protein HMPREF9145_1696 [Segatella salivae F0493]